MACGRTCLAACTSLKSNRMLSKPLIIIAHLAFLAGLPFWILLGSFAPMLLTGQPEQGAGYFVLFLCYLGPVLSILACFVLWQALWVRAHGRAHAAAWGVIAVQAVAGAIVLLS